MRQLLPFVDTYLRYSQHAIDLLSALAPLPPNTCVLTADATDTYSNIEPDIGIQTIIDSIDSSGANKGLKGQDYENTIVPASTMYPP
jgi:hypothetical protein